MKLLDKTVDTLRQRVRSEMSEWRFVHTAEVEKMAARLGELYLPEKIAELRIAALLHDITKEKSTDEQISLLKFYGICTNDSDRLSPKTLHARTAELVAADKYSEYVSPEILSAIGRHTTGHPDMTLFDAIIYLADYIEDTRTFPDCVELRRFFYDGIESGRDKDEVLLDTMIKSFDMTMKNLIEEGAHIDTDTVQARSYYLSLASSLKAMSAKN